MGSTSGGTASPRDVAKPSFRTGREEAAALAVLAARVSAAGERVLANQVVTRADRQVLSEMSAFLREEAESILFLTSSGSRGREPTRVAAAGIAADVIVRERTKREPTDEQLAKLLRAIAGQLDSLPESESRQAAQRIVGLFRKVSAFARTEAGSVGEGLSGRDSRLH